MDGSNQLIFASGDSYESQRISREEKAGRIRRIAPRLYTSNLTDEPSLIVRRYLFDILAWRLPGCVISHKSANLMRPTENGNFYVTASFSKRITELPGLIVNVRKGTGPLASDLQLRPGLYVSSEERWMLECFQPARKDSAGESKSFPEEFLEERLERMVVLGGEQRLNGFRDRAMAIAVELKMEKEFQRMNAVISALLSSHSAAVLHTLQGKARNAGMPLDASRAALFDRLYERLSNEVMEGQPQESMDEASFKLFSFYESYFSNYIEGTEFTLSEAEEIVRTGVAIPTRKGDSHDILGTYRLLSDMNEMSVVPESQESFLELLRHRHALMMENRTEIQPGMFKNVPNRAGQTEFVRPELVEGTLRYGFNKFLALTEPLARAIYMMFLCSEVHPFNDGNGRVSRAMMNSVLVSAGQVRIIVPTVYREDYLLSLRKLSRSADPGPYIRAMKHLQLFSSKLHGTDAQDVKDYLQRCNAFLEPSDGKLLILDR